MAVVPMYARLVDPSYLPKHLNLGDMLFRINALDHDEYQALETIIRDVFRRTWEAKHARRHETPW